MKDYSQQTPDKSSGILLSNRIFESIILRICRIHEKSLSRLTSRHSLLQIILHYGLPDLKFLIWFSKLISFFIQTCSGNSEENPGPNYFQFPSGCPNSLVPSLKNKYNKDFIKYQKSNKISCRTFQVKER